MERFLKSLLSVLPCLTLPAMVQAQFNYVTDSGTVTIFPAVNELGAMVRNTMTRIMVLLVVLVFQTVGAATVTFDGGVTYQTIDGFGANINHRSWTNDDLKPVIDALVDQAGMTLFRVVYDKTDWEATNENVSPYVMNWDYYSQVYSSTEFEKMWGLVGYLNQKGISNGVMFNFQGNGPAWLGVPVLNTGMEPEWAQMVGSLLIYARQTNQLQFGLVGPDNEMDQTVQGVNMTATQYVTALHDLSQLLDTNGLSDVGFVGPDLAGGGTTYMPQMMADPVVMSKVAHFGVHSYQDGGSNSAGVYSYIQGSDYPNRSLWVTEFNVQCGPCDSGVLGTYDWTYCEGTAEYLMQHLLNNASAGLVWEGYDSQYNYYNPLQWSFWGLFGVDDTNAVDKTYTARKDFYTLAQISKWVRPGAQRIGVSGSVASLSPLLAFEHAGLGQITIVGINTSASAATLSGALASLPTVSYLDLYYTSANTNLADGGSVAVNNGTFSATIPADCVFTLTGFAGVNVALTSPVNGAQFNAPAAIPLAATATTTAGSIALVGFYNGASEMGEATTAPYGFTWDNVPMGNYALTAVAGDTLGNFGTSAVVNVTVVGPLAQIVVTPTNATVALDGKQQFSATGADLLGNTLSPQLAFVWSVSSGGTIDGTGLFTAGSAAGGPFNVSAASEGITGMASVSVVVASGAKIGNTEEGTSTDPMWSNGAWINAGRFQAASNVVVSTMRAKVGAISGGYKCAIYADNGGSPSALLGGTAEVRNPGNGWNSFPFATSLALTNGQYYWLAIWSDNASAEVYYSDTSGTQQWGQYNYGAWPDPITTSGGGNLNYCIFATGVAAPLIIGAASLSNGVVNVAYSTTLAASGGTLPYNWSVASGSLPSGLMLNAGDGVITGSPTGAGVFNFTVQVSDASSPVQSATKALSLAVASPPLVVTIWPTTAIPGLVDGGPDSAVELGVKFRSDLAGSITGIRFYKATANTGTHVGNLWSSTGTLLGSITFSNETASGWQQMLFAAPVTITSNTVYVASYHANSGHHSEDDDYFSSNGVDSPPLHALADGVSGGNGVYAYGTSSTFPAQTYNAANYWVDVAFEPAAVGVSGAVAYYPTNYPASGLSGKVVGGVTMTVTGDAYLSGVTLGDGSYALGGMAYGGTYCVTPSKADDSPTNRAVTSADAALIQRYAVGLTPLDSPYKLLAADVNANGVVNTADATMIQRMVVGLLNTFPAGTWRFVPANYVFPDPQNPWNAPSNVWYTNLVADVSDGDFIAIRLGDLNNSWTAPAGGSSSQARRVKVPAKGAQGSEAFVTGTVPEVVFGVNQQSAQPGQTVTVGVTVSGFRQVTSAQFSLAWDPAVLRYVGTGGYGLRGMSAGSFGSTWTGSGKLAFGWYDPEAVGVTLADGTVLFGVSFEVIGRAGSVSPVTVAGAPTVQEVGVDFGLAGFGAQDGSVSVVGPGVVVNQPGYAKSVFRLSVPTEAGRSYSLEYSDTLAPAQWTELPAVVGDGTVTVMVDPAPTNQQRFYRVHVK